MEVTSTLPEPGKVGKSREREEEEESKITREEEERKRASGMCPRAPASRVYI